MSAPIFSHIYAVCMMCACVSANVCIFVAVVMHVSPCRCVVNVCESTCHHNKLMTSHSVSRSVVNCFYRAAEVAKVPRVSDLKLKVPTKQRTSKIDK